jgi:hypothetical protein
MMYDIDPLIGKRHGCEHVVICAQVEAELCDLSPAEATEFLQSLGVTDSGASSLICGAYHLSVWPPTSPLARRKSAPGPSALARLVLMTIMLTCFLSMSKMISLYY